MGESRRIVCRPVRGISLLIRRPVGRAHRFVSQPVVCVSGLICPLGGCGGIRRPIGCMDRLVRCFVHDASRLIFRPVGGIGRPVRYVVLDALRLIRRPLFS